MNSLFLFLISCHRMTIGNEMGSKLNFVHSNPLAEQHTKCDKVISCKHEERTPQSCFEKEMLPFINCPCGTCIGCIKPTVVPKCNNGENISYLLLL